MGLTLRACLITVFRNCFLFLKIKNKKLLSRCFIIVLKICSCFLFFRTRKQVQPRLVFVLTFYFSHFYFDLSLLHHCHRLVLPPSTLCHHSLAPSTFSTIIIATIPPLPPTQPSTLHHRCYYHLTPSTITATAQHSLRLSPPNTLHHCF